MVLVFRYDLARKQGKLRTLHLMAIKDSHGSKVVALTANPKAQYGAVLLKNVLECSDNIWSLNFFE